MPQCNTYQSAYVTTTHTVRMRLGFKFVSKSNTLFTHSSLPTIPSSLSDFPRSLPSVSKNFTFSGKKKLALCVQRVGYKAETQLSDIMESGKEIQELNRNLYPSIEPYSTGFLKVSDVHTIYWEQSGNPNGHPVVFLHGGPGGGTSPSNRRFFDPEFYRIILFDQRGAGKSTPHACLEENTTWDLIDDIEKLREHLEIPEWQVFGGSWGSTLALAYSQSHPDKVTGLVLRGIFLLRKKEIDWFYESGAAAIYPDAWEPFRDLIPENERESFVSAYHKRLNSDDLETQGRYDICCPMMSARDLHKAFPEADFKVVSDAGHSANEPGIAAELVAANEKLKNLAKKNGP
ncbi:proline iminopeptidase-like isoform X3 [Durio zibethinus]|uniref:Proline iminopeptidase n=1 Tax=Durio zibethinus TaxID=66656 RepID=A0A6P6ADH7_DURZI|nr:proline iminopeptidase-like isoform X3 [Durio zibethinus]